VIRALLSKAASALVSMLHPRSGGWLRWLLPNTKIDFGHYVGDGLGSNVLMAPILWIARAWLEARLGVLTETKDKEELDLQHPITHLLAEPNPFYSGAALWIALLISWYTDGNAYAIKLRNKAGQVKQLWYVPHWMIEPKEHETDQTIFIDRYEYSPGGGTPQVILAPQDVVHLRHGLDPRNVRKGLSMMKMLLREIFNDNESANFVAALLLNGGVPGVIISPKDAGASSPDALKETKEYVQDEFGGSNKGSPLVLGAPTEVKEFGYDPNKMNLDIVRNVSEERVCAMIGLPAAVVGFGSGMEQTKVGATLSELHRIAWIDCVIPNQDLMAQELTRSLREDFSLAKNQRLAWDRKSVRALEEDKNKAADRWAKLWNAGLVKRAVAKRGLGLEVEPGDDVYFTPIGGFLEGPDADPEPAPEPDPPPAKEAKGLDRRQARVLRAMDRVRRQHEKRLRNRLSDFFGKMGEAAAQAYLASEKAAVAAATPDPGDELRIETIFSSLNVPRLRGELRGIFGTHFVAVHNDTVGILAGMGIGVNLPDHVQLEVLSEGGTRADLVDLTEAARARAIEVVRAGREDGKGPVDIARELEEAIPAGRWSSSRIRAEVTARTETRFAQTNSALRAYESADGIDQVIMIDGRLGDTDEDCQRINGQPATFAEARRLIAEEHPNGTRDLVPAFSGGA